MQSRTLDSHTGFAEPCGGWVRGDCAYILETSEDYYRAAPETALDDRFQWPLRFFQFACECRGNFAGYMCHECRYGYTGHDCSARIVRVRKDFKTLTSTDKRYIMDLFEKARVTQSDYVLIDVSKGADPSENVSFVPASVYDYLAYVHYYASRKTVFRPDTYPGNETGFRCDDPHFESLDFAHKGTNFPMWHRYYMMLWESEMQKLSGNIHFTFPYWNWTDAGTKCDVCTDDFLGSHDIFGQISKASRVSNWYGLCLRQKGKCEDCNPRVRYLISRSPGKVKEAPSLPTSATVNFALSQNVFDYPDFSTNVPNDSFRGCLEGFSGIPQRDYFKLHNEVHMFFGGLLNSATSASWDPIFYFHHSFMDKLLEMWLQRTGAQPSQLPLTGGMPGHHRNSRLMAFFPVQHSALYFRPSVDLGYTYDDMIDNDRSYTSFEAPSITKEDQTSHKQYESTTSEVTTHRPPAYTRKSANFGNDRADDPVSGTIDRKLYGRLLTIVAVETALLLVVLLIFISACVHVLSRRPGMYTRVPSEDSYDGNESADAHVHEAQNLGYLPNDEFDSMDI